MTVRVMLVDDHPAILLGLTTLLEADPELEVVAAESLALHALATYRRVQPDVLVLDLSMPGLDGVELLQRVRAVHAEAAVLVLTSTSDPETVERLLVLGVNGYMRKDCTPAELVHAVHTVVRGDLPLDARLTRALLQRRPTTRPPEELTDRELEVLRLVAQGLANKQIAHRLGIGASTVKTHLSNAFQRIGVSDRTSAALWVRSHDAATSVDAIEYS